MLIADAEADLRRALEAHDVALADAAIGDVVDVVLDWYERQRFEGVELDADGDMVLVQWGPTRPPASGMVEIDVTRQFIAEEDMWQLSVSAAVPSSAVDIGNVWCHHPSDVESFRPEIARIDVIRHAFGCRGALEIAFGLV